MRVCRGIAPRRDGPVALTIGNFDGVHLGHQALLGQLREAARTRGLPAAVLTFEPHPREFFAPDKAPTRLTSLREKLELLRAADIDRVYLCRFNFEFARISAADFVGRVLQHGLGVRWLLVGDDFRFGARRAGDFALLKERAPGAGFEVVAMPSVSAAGGRVSSTAVREALRDGRLDAAAELLGRPYSISGKVVQGDRLGRRIGFPTANVQMKHNRPPLAGIFAVSVSGFGGAGLPGVASLGVRPTVKTRGQPTLEVHLLDFDADLYGRHLQVAFLHKFRDEEKYADVAALTRQIALDVDHARAYFRARTAAAQQAQAR